MDTFDNSLDNLEILPEYIKRFKTVKTKRDSLPSLAIYSNPIHATFGRERFRSEDLIFIPESSPCKQPFLCNDDNITFTMPRRIDIESDDDQDQDRHNNSQGNPVMIAVCFKTNVNMTVLAQI